MPLYLKIIIYIIAGFGAGLGTGFAGRSAAAIIGPRLAAFTGIPSYQAIGIGLISDVLASGLSAAVYWKEKNLDIKNSLILLLTVVARSIVGSYIAKLLPNNTRGYISQIARIILGLKFLIFPSRHTKDERKEQSKKAKRIKSIIGGVVVGFICGFVGAGGGRMLLLVLTSFLGYERHRAVGTSVFIRRFTALSGGVSHIVIGGVPDITARITCVISTLVFSFIASKIANKVDSKILNRVVGVLLIVTSAAILGVTYIPPLLNK